MSFSRTSRDIRLEGSSTLIAICERTDGLDPASSKLNLDDCLGNMDGSFQWGDGAFSHSSSNIKLDGTILRASLRKINGQMRRTHIDLDQRIANVGGRLVYMPPVEKEVEEAVLSAHALDSMWNSPALANANSGVLPPSGHFKSTLSQLRITLLAKTQHKSVHVVEGSPLVEPTLALYCPIEGGEHVIDATVQELAKETNSEVQVIDMAQVAAGEWGVFGKLASGYRFYQNPLGKVKAGENIHNDDNRDQNLRAFESFWRKLIESNPPAPTTTTSEPTSEDEPASKTPRIIYIRDFRLLSSRVNTWFPSLYTAIRARRVNGLGPKSPISNPTTVIFGVSPRLKSRQDWNEDATEERAKRLKELKERWDKGTLLSKLPSFKPTVKITKKKLEEEAAKDETKDQSESKAEEKPSDEKIESTSESKNEGEKAEKDKEESEESTPESDSDFEQELDGYFRSCIIAPAKRNTNLERTSRESRRRELNELILRMAVGVKSGRLEDGAAPVVAKKESKDGTSEAEDKKDDYEELTKGWEERVLGLDTLNDVVDHAIAIAMLSNEDEKEQEPIPVTWAQLQDAWRESKSSDEERKAWTKDGDSNEEDEKSPVDEVVEKVKKANLDQYEQRLLGCIVDVAKLQTTFENVHLPTHVVDSVRSIVSLPLMFPDAFKSGILKQQAISGALLFGPPGTGKTLLAIKPSDVADKWVGETEKLVSAVFKLARRLKPCVVFIDEIDSIMGSRMGNSCSGSSRWHTSMLTEFMQEMDGLTSSSVIVIGATNRPGAIDDAVLRRLPCRLLVDLPGVEAREEILKIMLRDDELGPDVSVNELARKTDRFSGSDLKHLCVAAAMDALKESVKLPWLTKKEESKDSTSANPDDLFKSKLATKETAQLEKGSAKSDSSDDESSRPDPNSKSPSSPSTGATTPEEKPGPIKPRILSARHFLRALMDVAPSSSETQGSLSELRKWNTQFGTGARDQPRTTGSLPYSYGGSGGVPGVSGLSNYSSSGLGSTGLGSSGLGSGGLGSTGLGTNHYGSSGLGATGLGSTGLGASGLGSAGLGSMGFNSTGLGSAGLGSSGLGSTGLGSSSLSSLSGIGSKGSGASGVGAYTPPSYTSPGMGGASTGYTPKLPFSPGNISGYTPSTPGGGPSAPGF